LRAKDAGIARTSFPVLGGPPIYEIKPQVRQASAANGDRSVPPAVQNRADAVVAVAPAGASRKPGHGGAEQSRGADHEGKDHRGFARALDVLLGTADQLVDAALGLGLSKPFMYASSQKGINPQRIGHQTLVPNIRTWVKKEGSRAGALGVCLIRMSGASEFPCCSAVSPELPSAQTKAKGADKDELATSLAIVKLQTEVSSTKANGAAHHAVGDVKDAVRKAEE
jgi:hypothetical protein